MTSKAKRTRDCPSCGWTLASGEKLCPQCGKELTSGRKKSGNGKRKSSKTSKVACPACGALISKRLKKCPTCKADFAAVPDNVPIQSIGEEPRTDLTTHETPVAGDEDKRSLCPSCQEVLEGTESKCPKCGTTLEGERKTAEPIAPVDFVPAEELPEIIEDQKMTTEPVVPIEPIPEEKLPETIVGESKTAEAVAPVESTSTKETPGTVGIAEGGESQPCHACGAVAPMSSQRCPICNASLVETAPQTEDLQPAPEASEARGPEEPTILPAEPEKKASMRTRKRKLISGKVTTVPSAAPTVDTGRTSSISHVNGSGKTSDRGIVNGTGMVNGISFVNGTGISNGIGVRPKISTAKRPSTPTRWQLLAVLVAFIIIMSVFVFFSYSNDVEEFSIDGDYADWGGATTYGTKTYSTAPSSNITEWAVGTQSSDLFLYFRTETSMMNSADAESYQLFVDSDGSADTGYTMESIGADYMLKLTGWDSAVQSTSLLRYESSSDQYNWDAWTSIDSLSCSLDGGRLEASAHMPVAVGESAQFVLVSKDHLDRGSVSYKAPLKGGVLIVEQAPTADVAATGIVPSSSIVPMLKLRFTCEGEGGKVSQVDPAVVGAPLANQEQGFTLEEGGLHEMTVAVDTSAVTDGQLVSAEIIASRIVSTFASVEIIGSGAKAYALAPPAGILIDGAFADWTGLLSADYDPIQVTSPGIDIDKVGSSSSSLNSYFYVSVRGDICYGTFVPANVSKPSGTGGGGVVVPTRHTAEDILTIYVDSDKSNSTGIVVSLDSKRIGADHRIEVKGLFGMITSTKVFDFSISSGKWVDSGGLVEAAKDRKRIEIGVGAMSLGGSMDIDFIVETTSWKGQSDLATFDTASMTALTRTWIVDPTLTNPYATSMSYQRKMFYDGINHWSFFFDGADTVCKYSLDDGKTWTLSGHVFTTSRVNETSIWYDSSTITVYAVGDTSAPSTNVFVQTGVVDAAAHKISWASSDSILKASTYAIGGKNTYISKDMNGYLWVLSTNWTSLKPWHDLSAFRSTAINSTSSWTNTGQILPWGMYENNSKGSIVPAGSGSDMWAVYTYAGYVAAKKYDGAWPEDYDEKVIFKPGPGTNTANTDNSPPSVVVDGEGVVHVVYGTDRADKSKRSIPQIEYSHSNPDLTFTYGVNLDPSNDSRLVANYYPTISLETSTDNLYVMWLQCDSAFASKTVMGRKCISGTWYGMTIEPQTSFTKQFMTSIYSVSGEYNICWQWTQNTTTPTQVLFDSLWIPEFSNLTPLVVASVVMFAIYRTSSRRKRDLVD